jgi:hypothetical protein
MKKTPGICMKILGIMVAWCPGFVQDWQRQR